MGFGAYLKTNFNGGIVDTTLVGRTDLDKVKDAVLIANNAVPMIGGAITRRRGLRITSGTLFQYLVDVNTGGTYSFVNTQGNGGFPNASGSQTVQSTITPRALRSWSFSPNDTVSFIVSAVRMPVRINGGVPVEKVCFVVHPGESDTYNANSAFTWCYAFPESCNIDEIQMDFLADTAVFVHQSGTPVRVRYTGTSPAGVPLFGCDHFDMLYHGAAVGSAPPMEPFIPENARNNKAIRINPASEQITAHVRVPLAYDPAPGSYVQVTLEGQPLLAIMQYSSTEVLDGVTVRDLFLIIKSRSVNITDNTARCYYADTSYDDDSHDNGPYVRCDKIVFGSHVEGAWMRWVNNYPDVRRPDLIVNQLSRWAYVEKYVGVRPVPVSYLIKDSSKTTLEAREFFNGNIYRIAKQGNPDPVIKIQVAAPGAASAPTWTDALRYDKLGDQFTWVPNARIETLPAGDVRIEDITRPVSMDTVKVSNMVVEGVNLTVIPEGVVRWSAENSISRSADMFAEGDFTRWTIGSYHAARFGTKWCLFRVLDAGVVQSDGTRKYTVILYNALPREATNAARPVESGITSEYVSSLFHQGDYPAAVAYFEQRLCFAGSKRYPETVWMSTLGSFTDFRTQDTDGRVLATSGISFSMAGSRVSRIRWMLSASSLLIGTDNSEWSVSPADSSRALTAENFRARQETTYGSSGTPLRVGSRTLFLSSGGTQLIEYGFSNDTSSFEGRDLLLLARNRVLRNGGRKMVRMAFSNDGMPLLHVLMDDGMWATCTYDQQNGVYAWAIHDHNIPNVRLLDVFTHTTAVAQGERAMVLYNGSLVTPALGTDSGQFLHLSAPDYFDEDPRGPIVCLDWHKDGDAGMREDVAITSANATELAAEVSAFMVASSPSSTTDEAMLCALSLYLPGSFTGSVAQHPDDDSSNRTNGFGALPYYHAHFQRRIVGPAVLVDAPAALPPVFPAGLRARRTVGYGYSSHIVMQPAAALLSSGTRTPRGPERVSNIGLCLIASGFVRMKQFPLKGIGLFYGNGGAQHAADYNTQIGSPSSYFPGDGSSWWFTGWIDLPFSGTCDANALLELRSAEASYDNSKVNLPYPLTVAAVRLDTV